MFGIDDWLASFSDATSLVLVCFVAVLLGLRHATDPDHLAAVSALIASGREASARAAGRLGLAWGAGHAFTLFAFGVPIVLFDAFIPARAQQGAETFIGLVIIGLAVWLLVRWRRGLFSPHAHDDAEHVHGHDPGGSHGHPRQARTPLGAFAVGLVHGMGGSAGVGILLVAAIADPVYGVVALGLLAIFTGLSMAILSSGLGAGLGTATAHGAFGRVAPALGVASLAFGIWYALGALELAPYVF
jgi:ABC-type nickel/cobalt efflux system permease component RcnA